MIAGLGWPLPLRPRQGRATTLLLPRWTADLADRRFAVDPDADLQTQQRRLVKGRQEPALSKVPPSAVWQSHRCHWTSENVVPPVPATWLSIMFGKRPYLRFCFPYYYYYLSVKFIVHLHGASSFIPYDECNFTVKISSGVRFQNDSSLPMFLFQSSPLTSFNTPPKNRVHRDCFPPDSTKFVFPD